MFRIITPLILLASAVGLFFVFSDPIYEEIKNFNTSERAYNEALNNSRQLKEVRDTLLARYNGFSVNDLSRLERMVPDNVENIRLIIEIERIASTHDIVLANVAFDSSSGLEGENSSMQFVTQTPEQLAFASRDYNTFSLEFSALGEYSDFINFVRDLEQNLRVVDIESITFSSSGIIGTEYEYNFVINTYWLKE